MCIMSKEDIERAVRRERFREMVKERISKDIPDKCYEPLPTEEFAYRKVDPQAVYNAYKRK